MALGKGIWKASGGRSGGIFWTHGCRLLKAAHYKLSTGLARGVYSSVMVSETKWDELSVFAPRVSASIFLVALEIPRGWGRSAAMTIGTNHGCNISFWDEFDVCVWTPVECFFGLAEYIRVSFVLLLFRLCGFF